MIEKEPAKKSFWTIWMFYILIAFEIIYMISPFGIYYYSIYGKGLNFLGGYQVTAWISSFFLPHIVETSSLTLNIFKEVGWILAILGFMAFFIGAVQIYYYKLSKKGAVIGGIYKYIRHPQYVSLSICSFGLLLVWPRYLVLIMLITMLFTYYFLARAEEKECEVRFGKSYTDYMNNTNMFVPFNIPLADKLPGLPGSGMLRKFAILTIFLLVLSTTIVLAIELRSYSLEKMYISYSVNSATISIAELEKDDIEKIVGIALSDKEVQDRLENANGGSNTKFLNYVLPAEWYFSDIPMNMAKGIEGHYNPEDYDKNSYKILINKADIKNDEDVEGKELILQTVKRTPLIEVKVDLAQNKVIAIENPATTVRWGDIPTPLF